ncbi:MAG: hypothetical protein COA33_007415 [Fluviicola sp.]|nr:hypothetical protein [Fluviicola sp.]
MSIIDGIMLVLFVLFMIFVFGGYHKNKSAQREAEFKRLEKKKKLHSNDSNESDKNSELNKLED